jgi:hypothetical protein
MRFSAEKVSSVCSFRLGDTVFQRGRRALAYLCAGHGIGGNKWPSCGGSLLGTSVKAQTIIEFTHRMTSGVAFFMVTILVLWCWRTTSKGNWATGPCLE